MIIMQYGRPGPRLKGAAVTDWWARVEAAGRRRRRQLHGLQQKWPGWAKRRSRFGTTSIPRIAVLTTQMNVPSRPGLTSLVDPAFKPGRVSAEIEGACDPTLSV